MNKYKKEMIELFRKLAQRHGMYEVFFDFTKMSAIAISNSFDLIQYKDRESEYIRIKKKYTDDEMPIFHRLLALLVEAMEAKPGDILGEMYMHLEIANKDAGQFFTPYHVAKLMAEMTFGEKEKNLENGKCATVYEPCVGGGVTIIALTEVMQARGYNYQKQLRVICGDMDPNVLSMAYVQFSLLGIDAVCERRDALIDDKPSDVWFTPLYAINRAKEAEENKSSVALEKMKKVIDMLRKIETPKLSNPEQLSLF